MRSTTVIILLFSAILLFYVSPYTVVAINGDSMEPTIPNGALLIEEQTEAVGQSDIVTFYSEQTRGLVTHRIIGEDSEGFITQGDNNPSTDQEIGISPLQPQEVEGKAVILSGRPLFIPYLGYVILSIQSNVVSVLAGLFGISLIINLARSRMDSQRVHSNLTAKDIFQPIFGVVIIVLTITFVLVSATVTIPFVYTDNPPTAEQQYVVPVGEENPQETITIATDNSSFTQQVFVSNGFQVIEGPTPRNNSVEFVVSLPTREETGVYRSTLTVYRLPPIIPNGLAQQMARVNPLIPSFISTLFIISPFYLFYRFYVGPNTPIRNPRINSLLRD